jgi:Reverse transcriptase (RNA-dependent DNA polymerase)
MEPQSKQQIENNKKSITRALNHEAKQYLQLEKEGYSHRKEHLKQRMNELVETDKTGRTSIKQLIHREKTRYDFQCIKKALKPKRSTGIKYILIPSENNPNLYNNITDPNTIIQQFLDRNIKHFSQAEKTPFSSEPLAQLFQYERTKLLIEQGIIPTLITEQDIYIQKFFEKLSQGKLEDVADDTSFLEFTSAIQKWNERTTTSPSGRHLGHYKIAHRIKVQEDDNQPDQAESLLKLYHKIISLAIKIGKPIKRWTNVTTCMIEKLPGIPRIDKMRVIHLFEVDYNLILKIMWARRTIWNAYNKQALNSGQAGSKPGSRAIDVVFNKEMKYTYAKLTRTPLATVDNDLKSCFDRILCNVAMMVSRYYGVPTNFCKLQSTTLKSTSFNIRTALGDSKRTYQHTTQQPIHGTGQGSCSSPAIWLLISSFIMDLLEKNAHGIKMYDINKKTSA